ncbi:MAG: mannonate dehydratase [Clostridia bacterium]|nr:mannonate dehydratase [Clostridia bacterium]
MKMALRWFGSGADSVTLSEIRQIPAVGGVVSSFEDVPVGQVVPKENILSLKGEIEAAGLKLYGIESINVHDAIKVAGGDRDFYIENYIRTIQNLGKNGIGLICYNFMPVFDWLRSELDHPCEDGSFTMKYESSKIEGIRPEVMIERMRSGSGGFSLPGWEPERLNRIEELFDLYAGIDGDTLLSNLIYFLKAIMPACEKYGVKMAIHPDDPPRPVFGLPRVIYSPESIRRLLNEVNDPYNGLTFCTGSLGAKRENDLVKMAYEFADRIHFAHLRNIRFTGEKDFEEAAHPSAVGDFDMYAIAKALYDGGFDGIVRPDHGRMIWGERARPGYGLYDRAMGACYLSGLFEAIRKGEKL